MAFSFAPTYQDYLSNYGKGGDGAFSETQWNGLGAAGQWRELGGGLALGKDDPRYAALAQQLGMTDGGRLNLGYKPQSIGVNRTNYVDPNAVLQGDDVYATAHSNETPKTQFAGGGLSDKGWLIAALSVLGGGAALGTALGGTAAAGTGAATTGGFSGFGDIAASGGVGTEGLGTGTMTGLAGDESAGLNMGNSAAGAAGDESAGLSMANQFPGGNSSLLQQLNTGRQYFNGARSVMNLLSGGQQRPAGQRSGGMGSTDLGSLISSLFGGSGGGGGGLGGILGLLANGHSMFGGGIGTASGAQAAADKASGLADPWGQSGRRQQFNDILTPDRAMSLMSQDPSQVLNNPAYKFALDQGTNAINVGDAAQGTLRSGNRGYELQQYGQGLASQYGQQYFNNNMTTLNALSGLAGVNASSPTAAAQSQLSGFDNASNIRNAGLNGLFSGGSSNPLMGGIGSLLSSLGGAGSSLMNLFSGGNGSFDMSGVDFGNLPDFNDTSGWDPSQFFSYGDDTSSLADATGAFF
jgi:hypothetical protein